MFGSQILFMNLGPTEILIIALVVLGTDERTG